MFYGAEVNVCMVKGEGWIRMKASRQSALGKQKKKMYIIFLFIANRDGLKSFGEGAGAINHNRVNCGPLPPYRLACVKFYIALFDSMTVTKRHLGFYTVYCEKGMSVTLYIPIYTLQTNAATPTPVSIGTEVNTIINVYFFYHYNCILYMDTCLYFDYINVYSACCGGEQE